MRSDRRSIPTPRDAAPVAATAPGAIPRITPAAAVRRRLDPRLWQIGTLAVLLIYGMGWLDFEIRSPQAAITLATALFVQWACTRLWKLPAFDPRSALISGLSLCLLLRTNSLIVAALAATLAIACKFVLSWRRKHVFNPTNFAVVAMLIAGTAWVSPGQWGNVAFFAFLMACLGGLVVNRAARSDVTFAFLFAYGAILFGRALWLGQKSTVPLHQMENGAFLLFAFFMISDPRTTPDSRIGRLLFASLVAAGAATVQFVLYRTNGLLWSLATFSLVVPLIDRLLPGPRYTWSARNAPRPTGEGNTREDLETRGRNGVPAGALRAGRA
jgi:Na+-transporting NADH:ubiquinone oxidoreductase subunit NqrB